jgi:hypothetical protein
MGIEYTSKKKRVETWMEEDGRAMKEKMCQGEEGNAGRKRKKRTAEA